MIAWFRPPGFFRQDEILRAEITLRVLVILAPLLLVILTLNPSPFVILSEESNPAQGKLCEESYGAQDRLREGEKSSPPLTLTVTKGLKGLLTRSPYIRNM